jgi:predicted dehydrogenase
MDGYFRVHGSKGVIDMEPAFGYQGQHLKATIQGQPPIDEPNPNKDPSQFVTEADYFSQCVFDNTEPKTNGEEGLRDMQYMADIYRSCGRSLR